MNEYFHLQCPECLRTVRMDDLPSGEKHICDFSDELCHFCKIKKEETDYYDEDYYYDD